MIGCTCAVCRSDNPRNKRWRAGAQARDRTTGIALVDTPTDLRAQALRFGLPRVDAVLFTHSHADHVFGLDDVRIFNFRQRAAIPCYGSAETLRAIRRMFAYVFEAGQEGGGKPQLELIAVRAPFALLGRQVVPVPVWHGEMEVFGYRLGSFAYVTDCNLIPEESFRLLAGVEILILDALRYRPHSTHFSVEEALAAAARIGAAPHHPHPPHPRGGPRRTGLPLPPGVELGYDGLVFESPTQLEPFAVPSGRRARGRLRVPSSKSLTHRYFNLALLSGAPVVIERPLYAEDTRLFLAALGRCGFAVEESDGRGAPDPGAAAGRPAAGEVEILCGNAGTMLRFLVATLDRDPRPLAARRRAPPARAAGGAAGRRACAASGPRSSTSARQGYIPLRIEGGSLRGGVTILDAGESSQYLSALLMAALRAPAEVVVEVPTLTSRPYVDVTLAAAATFDGHIERAGPRAYRVRPSALRGGRVRVEGDYSAACYPAAAAALTGGEVMLDGLSPDSRQGDREFIDLLAAMGAEVVLEGRRLRVRVPRAASCGGSRPTSPGCPTRCPPSPRWPRSPPGRR